MSSLYSRTECVEQSFGKANIISLWTKVMMVLPENTLIPYDHWKHTVRAYLEEVSQDEKKIEYTLFQPDLFTNIFASPRPFTRQFSAYPWLLNYKNHQAVVVSDANQQFTTTTIEDLSSLVDKAIDYDGE